MHRNHDIFLQGIKQEKRLELTYFSRKHCSEVVSICAPLHFSKGAAVQDNSVEDELECYYFWDFGAEKGSNFLALSPSQIISMKLTEVFFHVQEFYSLSKKAGNAAEEPDVNEQKGD